jgi:RND family efflux transporter MFP subunit
VADDRGPEQVHQERAVGSAARKRLIGGILSILIIFFFLRDGWSTFVIGLSLPVSIIATFFFMDQLGLSLNVMSLAGLALATGMVVDDSIVVLESIAKQREHGWACWRRRSPARKEVSMAVVASTLTTVAVFFPLVFVEGVAGQLFKDQALTVSIALMISLVVSLTLIPMLSSLKAKAPMAFAPEERAPAWQPENKAGKALAAGGRGLQEGLRLGRVRGQLRRRQPGRGFARTIGAWMAWLGEKILLPYERAATYYHGKLPRALERPWVILGSAAVAFLISIGIALTLGTDLIPQLAQDRFEMTAQLPPGTQLRETDALVRAVQQKHDGDTTSRRLYGVSGTGTRLDANPTESGENVAKLSVVLGEHYNKETEAAVTERMRATMAAYPDIAVKFGRPQLFSFSTPLEIELRGQDLDALQRAGRRLSADDAWARTASRFRRSRRCRSKSPRPRATPSPPATRAPPTSRRRARRRWSRRPSGVMVQLLAEEGDQVHAGQVLARLDGDKVRLEAARQLATVRKLENNYRRSQELAEKKLVSAEASDQIKYDLESARAAYDLAKLELSYTSITAPISGVVAQRMVKPGNLIALNAPVFRIVNNSHLEGVLNAPEREMGRPEGRPAAAHGRRRGAGQGLRGQGRPHRAGDGFVQRHLPRGLRLRQRAELRPGMFGRIEVVYDQRTDALTVPRVALLEDEGEPAVYVIQGKKAKRTTVQLGYTNGEIAEIRSGLKEGDQVVTAGKVAIRDGTEVQVIDAAGAARARWPPPPGPRADMNLVEFATRRRVTVAMVTLTFVLFGFIALGSLKVNLLPDLSYPTLTVRTEYTGAAPARSRR